MREGVSDAPLAKCCGSRHGTANLLFCSPFSPVFGFLSRHIIGSAWFLFHWRALSEVQTVIYLVSPIPRIAPSVSPAPPHVKYQLRDRRTQTVALDQESPWARWNEGGKTQKNTTDCICFTLALQRWFVLREKRHQWHFRWCLALQRARLWIFFYTHTTPSWCSPFLVFNIWPLSSTTTTAELN